MKRDAPGVQQGMRVRKYGDLFDTVGVKRVGRKAKQLRTYKNACNYDIFTQEVTHLKQAFVIKKTPIALSIKSIQIILPKSTLILANNRLPFLPFFLTSSSFPNPPPPTLVTPRPFLPRP